MLKLSKLWIVWKIFLDLYLLKKFDNIIAETKKLNVQPDKSILENCQKIWKSNREDIPQNIQKKYDYLYATYQMFTKKAYKLWKWFWLTTDEVDEKIWSNFPNIVQVAQGNNQTIEETLKIRLKPEENLKSEQDTLLELLRRLESGEDV